MVRFFEYKNYLLEHREYTHVLLTDVRDVIFQVNPFDDISDAIYIGIENKNITIADEKYNRSWICDAYGSDVYNQLKGELISCSGVTLGDAGRILEYLDSMITEFLNQPLNKMIDRLYDQAMHNKLLYFNKIDNVVLCYPLESKIATVGTMNMNEFKLNSRNQLLNADNTVAAIVHQYDRHSYLTERLLNTRTGETDCKPCE